jgi:Zn-dependent protease/CBS domain-containing protein
MQRNSLHLFTIFGIPIRVHVSWLIIFVLITWSLAAAYFPSQYKGWTPSAYWTIGIITSLLFFLSVLLHELAHSVIARLRGMNVRDIVLFVFGGVSELGGEPGSAGTEFIMALVGPLTSFAIGVVSLAVWRITKPANGPISAVAYYLFWINMLLGVFNLIPGFPLDGGRVLRSIIWGVTGNLRKATRAATAMGNFIAYVFIFVGIWQVFAGQWVNGLWIAFIGWFLHSAAQSSYSTMIIKDLLSGHTVSELVNRDYPKIPSGMSVDALVHDYILKGRRCLPVIEGDRYIGLITVHNVQAAPRERWHEVRVADVMIPAERVYAVPPDGSLWSALEQMTEKGVHQLAVLDKGSFTGMLARDAVMGFLRMHAELNA